MDYILTSTTRKIHTHEKYHNIGYVVIKKTLLQYKKIVRSRVHEFSLNDYKHVYEFSICVCGFNAFEE